MDNRGYRKMIISCSCPHVIEKSVVVVVVVVRQRIASDIGFSMSPAKLR